MSEVKEFEPELGQALFGQPWQEYEAPGWLQRIVLGIGGVLEGLGICDYNPTGNYGEQYDNDVFYIESYSWDDDPQACNFAWRDFKMSWYKWIGRGTTVNRVMEKDEARTMMLECLESIIQDTRWFDEE